MTMPVEGLEVAAGSVIGRHHALAGRNRQDAWAVWQGPTGVAVSIADGCSAGDRSEVGAELGVRLLTRALSRRAGLDLDPEALAREASDEVLAGLRAFLATLESDAAAPEAMVRTTTELLLFTLLGALVEPRRTCIVGLGDGVIALGGVVRELGPYPDNKPPYLGYALLGADLGLEVLAEEAGDQFESLVLATDGAAPLFTGGDDAWLWTDDRVFTNPDGLRRRLAARNRPPAPRFADDATVAVVRRNRRTS